MMIITDVLLMMTMVMVIVMAANGLHRKYLGRS